jgi:type II secretory pathway pseudopilin PulG
MKNKLKGVTLLETVLYIGLFSIILFIVVNFMLTAQESSRRTNESERLHRTKHFISQHIDYSFQNSDEIDETNSIFDNDLGKLTLTIDTLPKSYELVNDELIYDGIPISSPYISVERFLITPIYEDIEIVGIKIDILLRDRNNTELTEEINLLTTFR